MNTRLSVRSYHGIGFILKHAFQVPAFETKRVSMRSNKSATLVVIILHFLYFQHSLADVPSVSEPVCEYLIDARGNYVGKCDSGNSTPSNTYWIPPRSPTPAELSFDRGLNALRSGNHTQCVNEFDFVIQHEDWNNAAWFNRGICLGRSANYRSAIRSVEAAIKRERNAQYYVELAWLHSKTGDHKSCLREADRAIKLNGQYHAAWGQKAWCYLALGDLTNAESAARQAADNDYRTLKKRITQKRLERIYRNEVKSKEKLRQRFAKRLHWCGYDANDSTDLIIDQR